MGARRVGGAPVTTEALATLERRAGRAMALVALSGVLPLAPALWLLFDAEGYDEDSAFALAFLALRLSAFVAAAVGFLQWLHRAVACARGLLPRPEVLGFEPRDAVVSFFLPIANLWAPYQRVSRLSEVLDPHALPEPAPGPAPAGERRPPCPARWPETAPAGGWWAAWLAATVLGRVAALTPASSAPALRASGALAGVLAAALAVLVIRSIALRVRELARRRSVPLPPPPFYG